MTENDPFELADQREREADRLSQRSDEVAGDVADTRKDWERKRADDAVPGAPPREGEEEREPEPSSPAPQAPPPSAGPGEAETPPEGGAGPPADVIDD